MKKHQVFMTIVIAGIGANNIRLYLLERKIAKQSKEIFDTLSNVEANIDRVENDDSLTPEEVEEILDTESKFIDILMTYRD